MKRKNRHRILLGLIAVVCCCTGCNEEEEKGASAPKIVLNETKIYVVKAGEPLVIAPSYQNATGAIYTWKLAGKIVGEEPSYTFRQTEPGEYFMTVRVDTEAGSAEEELRVDVVKPEKPVISFSIPEEGFRTVPNHPLLLVPQVKNGEGASFRWSIGDETVGRETTYSFSATATGSFTVALEVTNEDGNDRTSVRVEVLESLPMTVDFEREAWVVSLGHTLRLTPSRLRNARDAVFTWSVDGIERQKGAESAFLLTPESTGNHTVTLHVENDFDAVDRTLTVETVRANGTFRKATSASRSECDRVFAFLPAPGQFVNEGYTVRTPEEACAYALDQLQNERYVSLGGFGGYIVVGFDHSIENKGSYDIAIKGNSFAGSSEPGIVWVMQDENGDGEPNDTWYELKGSEYDKPETIREYEVTYYRPREKGMDVPWTDNLGNTGYVDYMAAYHRQDCYYPLWVEADSYTLRGTRLEPNVSQNPGSGIWYNGEYAWGYADNFGSDRLSDDDNHFRISDAVTFDGKPANLKYIDFIKVQTAVNSKAGWLGENSTEVFGFSDMHLL